MCVCVLLCPSVPWVQVFAAPPSMDRCTSRLPWRGCSMLDVLFWSCSARFRLVRSEVHISWDEPTIAEHDKLRGTRQKIDEPSTPYHYGSGESSTGSDCESAGTAAPRSARVQRAKSPGLLSVCSLVKTIFCSSLVFLCEEERHWIAYSIESTL